MEEVPPDILQFVQADLTALITWNESLDSQKKKKKSFLIIVLERFFNYLTQFRFKIVLSFKW